MTRVELIIDNSECQINGLSIQEYKQLKELLSYVDNPTGYPSPFVRTKYLIDKKGVFPTGLLYLVQRFIKQTGIQVTTLDKRKVPERQEGLFTWTSDIKPYPEQLEAAKRVKKYGRGIVTAPTGVGKSLICALTIYELQVPTLIVVPSLELKRQLSETLSSIFGKGRVGRDKPIYVENVDSLASKTLKTKYDCLIIDEFHRSGARTYRKLNKKQWSGIYYKAGVTATPFRSQDNERLLLESVLSQVIYQVDYQTAVQKGYIVPMEAYYLEIPPQKIDPKNWAEAYSKLVVNNQVRNDIVAQVIRNLKAEGVSTLCLVKEIAHGEALSRLAGVHFANGQSEDTEDLIKFFSKDKIKALIGTTGVLGEGVDTKPAEFIIIAGLGKSKNAFMQQVGRGFRVYGNKESCKVILFKDNSHKWTRAHFAAQVKYLREEYGIEPIKLPLPLIE